MRKFLRVLTLIIGSYLALLLALALLQRRMIYLPSRGSEASLLDYAAREGLEPWRDAAGTIIGWKARSRPGATPTNRMVVFHGNAGFALLRSHFVEGFGGLDEGRLWDVHLFEYPGFGARRGALGEASFLEAGTAAIAQLAKADRRPIYLLGESLGSGLGTALAARRDPPIAGLFLLTPYASLPAVAKHHYPWVPVTFILRDRWDSLSALPSYRGRVAVMIASDDEVCPAQQGRQLFEAAHQPKRLWVQEGATHNTIDFDPASPWWREVSDFLLSAKR